MNYKQHIFPYLITSLSFSILITLVILKVFNISAVDNYFTLALINMIPEENFLIILAKFTGMIAFVVQIALFINSFIVGLILNIELQVEGLFFVQLIFAIVFSIAVNLMIIS